MVNIRLLYIFFLLGWCCLSVSAQEQKIDSTQIFNPLTDDITEKLPPLEALIDSAIKHSPKIQNEEFNIAYRQSEVTTAKRDWTHYINLGLDVNNGTWWFDDKDELTRLNRYYLTTSNRAQYEVAVSMRLPIFYIIDRRNEINKRKSQVEQAVSSRNEQERSIRTIVIEHYMNMVGQQNALRVSNDYQQYTALQMKMAENEFLNGEIAIVELSRQKEIQTRGALEYEQIKAQFKKSYLLLQETVGIEFNLIFNLK